MITRETEERLFNLFFLIRTMPGWLADCVEAGFDEAEIHYLEWLAGELAKYEPSDDVAEWDKQIEREGGADVYFEEGEDDKIRVLSQKIAEAYREYEQHMWNDGPYDERAIILKIRNPERLERLRRSIRGRQLHKTELANAVAGRLNGDQDWDSTKTDRITDHDIERAREYPLERLIPDFDMARAGYVRCRWHEDKKPSMLVKNGFGYCFSCMKSVDSIRWLMEVDNLAFIDAVKYLRGKC